MTNSVLILAYYLVITPSALIKRMFGGRPLPIRPDKSKDTYWVDRASRFSRKNDLLNGIRMNNK